MTDSLFDECVNALTSIEEADKLAREDGIHQPVVRYQRIARKLCELFSDSQIVAGLRDITSKELLNVVLLELYLRRPNFSPEELGTLCTIVKARDLDDPVNQRVRGSIRSIMYATHTKASQKSEMFRYHPVDKYPDDIVSTAITMHAKALMGLGEGHFTLLVNEPHLVGYRTQFYEAAIEATSVIEFGGYMKLYNKLEPGPEEYKKKIVKATIERIKAEAFELDETGLSSPIPESAFAFFETTFKVKIEREFNGVREFLELLERIPAHEL